MPKIKINATEFYYELHGKGQPIVMISGYTCDSQFYLQLIDELKDNYQILIFDNRGIGQTKDDGKPLTAEIMAKDVIDLCDTLDIQNPSILGQSMGGTIAQTIAANYPDKINKLILVATSAKWRQAMLKGLGSILDLGKAGCNIDLILNAAIPWVYGEKFLSNPENINDFKKAVLTNPFMQSLCDQSRQYEVLINFNGLDALSKITAETLILYGTEDLISLPIESKRLSENIKNSIIKSIDCGHDIPNEATKDIAKEVANFLA
jgi:pimeloyl-ACP methyl ester carboxylesterase